jgi:hypothetical protein
MKKEACCENVVDMSEGGDIVSFELVQNEAARKRL